MLLNPIFVTLEAAVAFLAGAMGMSLKADWGLRDSCPTYGRGCLQDAVKLAAEKRGGALQFP